MGTLHLRFDAMGTQVELITAAPPGEAPRLRRALERAEDWVREAEAILSRFDPDSELSRLNAAAGKPCLVSPLLAEVLAAALTAARESDGLYDPTVLPCLQAAGYRVSLEALPQAPLPDGGAAAGWRPAWPGIRLNPGAVPLVQTPAQCQLDFGGIAKGWAADRLCADWRQGAPLVVSLGGDLRVRLPPDDAGWPVTVADPFAPERDLARLRVRAGGVATSSSLGRRWLTDQGWRHHIIDPRNGTPADSDVVQATVLAPTAVQAEVWAKALCILGSEAGFDFLARRPAAALVVRHDGTVMGSANLEVYLDGFFGRQTGT